MRRRTVFVIATLLIGLRVSADAWRASDLMIKTRTSFGTPQSTVITDVLYRSGDRRRRETTAVLPDTTAGHPIASAIDQCDLHQHVALFPEHRTFILEPMVSAPAQLLTGPRAADPPAPSLGPIVTVTVETRDTGERRQVGSLVARRVQTTRTTTPSQGASMPGNVETTDGWYVDVDRSCQSTDDVGMGLLFAQQPGRPVDQIRVVQRGPIERGVPIESTRHDASAPQLVTRVTLVELSERPIDPQLFEIPADYRAAVPLPFGGFDPSRPDSVRARVQAYAEWIAAAVTGAIASFVPR